MRPNSSLDLGWRRGGGSTFEAAKREGERDCQTSPIMILHEIETAPPPSAALSTSTTQFWTSHAGCALPAGFSISPLGKATLRTYPVKAPDHFTRHPFFSYLTMSIVGLGRIMNKIQIKISKEIKSYFIILESCFIPAPLRTWGAKKRRDVPGLCGVCLRNVLQTPLRRARV